MAPAPARKSTAKAAAPPHKSTAKAAAPTGVNVKPAARRLDPVTLLEEQNATRLCHGWCPAPRPDAGVAVDLLPQHGPHHGGRPRTTPTSGLQVQLSGDAHLFNFGAYASAERELVFDANDFDETLPGPWEWDVKRLAASFTVADQHLSLDRTDVRRATATVVRAYRQAMADYVPWGYLDLWYGRFTIEDSADSRPGYWQDGRPIQAVQQQGARAHKPAGPIEADRRGRRPLPHPQPAALLVPLRELRDEASPAALEKVVRIGFEQYKSTLSENRRTLLERFPPIEVALKVVGVGSVGTRCLIMLLEGRDRDDPLFLEAGPSVLEEHVGASVYPMRSSKSQTTKSRPIRNPEINPALFTHRPDAALGQRVPDGIKVPTGPPAKSSDAATRHHRSWFCEPMAAVSGVAGDRRPVKPERVCGNGQGSSDRHEVGGTVVTGLAHEGSTSAEGE